MENNHKKNGIQSPVFTTTLLLLSVILVFFNFNLNIVDTNAQITGGGNAGYLARCLPSGSTSSVVGGGNVGYLVKWVSPSGSPSSVVGGCSTSQYLAKWATGTLTLTASFTATPATFTLSQPTNLQTVVGGTATGTINYTMWWDCAYNDPIGTDPTPTVAEAAAACGGMPAINCTDYGGAIGHKCDASAVPNPPTAYSVSHTYLTAGTKRPIVIVERAGLVAMGVAGTGVTVNPPSPPTVANTTVAVNNSNFCAGGPHATISWIYSDPAGNPQTDYEALINGGADINIVPDPAVTGLNPVNINPEWWGTGTTVPPYPGPLVGCNSGNSDENPQTTCQLTWNTQYTAWARVKNSAGVWSAWTRMATYINGVNPPSPQLTWTTPIHAFPSPDFSISATSPAINSPVTFTETLPTFDALSTFASRSWNFGDNTSLVYKFDGTQPFDTATTSHAYTAPGSYTVRFRGQDELGVCESSAVINVQQPLPRWREVAPR